MNKKRSLFFIAALLCLFASSCDGKRPDNGILEFDLTVRSLQKNAEVGIFRGESPVASGKTDEKGEYTFLSIQESGDFNVKVCGGTIDLVSSAEPVAWNGCTERSVKIGENSETTVTVDFLSSFIEKYDSETSRKEWFEYLGISGDVFPELQSSLTDATKRYLWQQAFARIAESVSKANETAAETQFSTETLLDLLSADLDDDSVINGSTASVFGTMQINAAVMKGTVADALSSVSDRFSVSEVKEWSGKIRNSEAAFLGDGKEEKTSVEIEIEAYREGMKGAESEYLGGTVVVEAAAKPEKSVVLLNCSVNGVKIADKDEKNAFFKGSFSSESMENGATALIRCEASNGVDVKAEEKSILINNEMPEVVAYFYEYGTLNSCAGEENPARNTIDIKVEATHKVYAVEDLECSVNGLPAADSSSAAYQYKTVVNTEELPDGKNILECSAGVNGMKYKVSFPFFVKNTVLVNVKAYIANQLSDIGSVSVSCGGDFYDKTAKETFAADRGIPVKLGEICHFSVSGGRYRPVVSDNSEEERIFNGTLSAVYRPVSDEDIVVTPLTTVESYVFIARSGKGDVPPDELYKQSKEHLSKHLSYSFEWNEEPLNTKSFDNATKYYALLAGMEYLAYFWETKTGSEHGKYNIVRVLQLLDEDYRDLSFDGRNGGTQLSFGEKSGGSELDSNFFRYYYALSVKRFLASGFNDTGFTQLGNIVNTISSNTDQFLFPAGSDIVPIDWTGVEINSFVFTDLFEVKSSETTEIVGYLGNYGKGEDENTEYDLGAGIIPYFAKAFLLKFKVVPHEGNFIDINSVSVKSMDGNLLFSIKKRDPLDMPPGGFSGSETEFAFLLEYSDEGQPPMEKKIPFSVSAQDIAFNTTEKEIFGFLDDKKPFVAINVPEVPVRPDDVLVSWNVSDNRIKKIYSVLSKEEADAETDILAYTPAECGEAECVFDGAEFVNAVSNAIAEGRIDKVDGIYIFTVSAFDYSGNFSTVSARFEVDGTPPELPVIRVESNGKILFGSNVTNQNNFNVSLVNPDDDVYLWSVKIVCQDRLQTQNAQYTRPYVAADETISFENLLKPEGDFNLVECKAYLSACDEVGNCANGDFSESVGSVFIDTQPPFYWGFDEEQSVFKECVDSSSNGLVGKPCLSLANCSASEFFTVWGQYQPQILLTFTDNYSLPGNMQVIIQNTRTGWFKYCSYVPNSESLSENNQGTCNKFYCNLEGSENGLNNIRIRAYDEVGNYVEVSEPVEMDMSVTEPINLTVDRFVTDKGRLDVTWKEKSGVEYECRITKKGDTAFSSICRNAVMINPSDLPGSGYYTVTVVSRSAATTRTDSAEFKYFNTQDLSLTLEPVEGQFLRKNGTFKVKVVAGSGGIAEIKKIKLNLYGRYLNGVLQDNTKYQIVEKSFTTDVFGGAVSSLSSIYSGSLAELNMGTGQYRKMEALVTFADNTTVSRTFTQSSSKKAYLYCLLESDEKADNAKISYKNGALEINYTKPKCLASSDYTLNLTAYYPSLCGGSTLLDSAVSVDKITDGKFKVTGDFDFYKSALHYHREEDDGWNSDEEECGHYCVVRTHSFSADTSLRINYNCGKTFDVKSDSSVSSAESATYLDSLGETSEWCATNFTMSDCKKCNNKMSAKVNCSQSVSRTVELK